MGNRLQRAIKKSNSKEDLYFNLNESISFLVSLGYDYESVLNWNVGGFFYMLTKVTKFAKIKYGAK